MAAPRIEPAKPVDAKLQKNGIRDFVEKINSLTDFIKPSAPAKKQSLQS